LVVGECGGDEDEEVDGVSPADLHPGVQDVTEIVRKPVVIIQFWPKSL